MPSLSVTGNRKWSVAMVGICGAIALCWTGRLSGAEFVMIAGAIVGAFFGANTLGDHRKPDQQNIAAQLDAAVRRYLRPANQPPERR